MLPVPYGAAWTGEARVGSGGGPALELPGFGAALAEQGALLGAAGSVMEYPSVNLAPEGEATGHYWSPGVGTYDRWAISVGYAADPERARRLARRAADRGHLFGNEAGGPGALDPTINIWDHVGDPDGRLPLEPVAVGEQREALDLLVERVLAADALDVPSGVLQRLGPNRWTHWGTSTTFDGRLDYPWHEQVADLQEAVLEQLLHPWRLARIRDAEARWGQDATVGIPELTDRLTDAVWSELEAGGRTGFAGSGARWPAARGTGGPTAPGPGPETVDAPRP